MGARHRNGPADPTARRRSWLALSRLREGEILRRRPGAQPPCREGRTPAIAVDLRVDRAPMPTEAFRSLRRARVVRSRADLLALEDVNGRLACQVCHWSGRLLRQGVSSPRRFHTLTGAPQATPSLQLRGTVLPSPRELDHNRRMRATARPQVYAHRGASANMPENTMAAFLGACDLGVDGIEFDVHQTSDGSLVVIHD